MLRHKTALKRLFVVSTLFFALIMPTMAKPSETIPVTRDVSNGSQMELVQNEIQVQDMEIKPLNTQKVKDTVVPDPRQEGKKIMALFFRTMMYVALFTIIIYFILLFVKKFYSSSFVSNDSEDIQDLDLSSPSNKQDALRSFLNRSR